MLVLLKREAINCRRRNWCFHYAVSFKHHVGNSQDYSQGLLWDRCFQGQGTRAIPFDQGRIYWDLDLKVSEHSQSCIVSSPSDVSKIALSGSIRFLSVHTLIFGNLVPAFSGLPFLDFFGVVSRWECDDFNAKQDWVLWKLGEPTPAVRVGMFGMFGQSHQSWNVWNDHNDPWHIWIISSFSI